MNYWNEVRKDNGSSKLKRKINFHFIFLHRNLWGGFFPRLNEPQKRQKCRPVAVRGGREGGILTVLVLGLFPCLPRNLRLGQFSPAPWAEPCPLLARRARAGLFAHATCTAGLPRVGFPAAVGFPSAPDRIGMPYGNTRGAVVVLVSRLESSIFCATGDKVSALNVCGGNSEIKDLSPLTVI